MWNHFISFDLLTFVVYNLEGWCQGISLQDSSDYLKEIRVNVKWNTKEFIFKIFPPDSSFSHAEFDHFWNGVVLFLMAYQPLCVI